MREAPGDDQRDPRDGSLIFFSDHGVRHRHWCFLAHIRRRYSRAEGGARPCAWASVGSNSNPAVVSSVNQQDTQSDGEFWPPETRRASAGRGVADLGSVRVDKSCLTSSGFRSG